MRKSHRADRRHRETRPLDREGGSAGRRHPPAGCARRAPAEELSRACKQRPPASAARSSSGPAPHLEGTAPAGPHRCPGAVVGAPPGPDGRAAPAEGAPRRRAGQEGEQPGLRAAELHARQRHPAAATEEDEPRRGGGGCRTRPAGVLPAGHTRTRGGCPPRPSGTRGAAAARALVAGAAPEQHFGRLRSTVLRRARRRATPRRPAAPRWNRRELAVASAYVRRPVTPRSEQPATNFSRRLRLTASLD